MTEELRSDWPERQARDIGERVKTFREVSGMRVQSVADICTHELGYKLNRTSLNNLEAGLRKSVSVAEVAAIATAIGTSPLSLIVDPGSPDNVEIVGGTSVSSWQAWKWWIGDETFGIVDGQDNELAKGTARIVRDLRLIDSQLKLHQRQVERGMEEYSRESAMMILLAKNRLDDSGVKFDVPDSILELGRQRLREIEQRGMEGDTDV